MEQNYERLTYSIIITLLIMFFHFYNVNAQSFSQKDLNFNGKGNLNNGTSLMFGPDERLYVAEYTGEIKILSLERTGPGDYMVTDVEILQQIQSIPNYNDDGTSFSSAYRETVGLTVTGTSEHPVIYVASSDFRIGGGGGGGSGDVGLDTNSGIITRFSWNGTGWDVVDIVRGLPRSEENHATNGMEFRTINGEDYLIVAQGGHTNGGSPSVNFAFTTEYALSAAILSVNLSMLESMPVRDDNGRKYIYDLPTVDDPTRPNLNGITDPDDPAYDGIDINDPFGGNDGLNQAKIVEGGPVQIFSPGYRNAYDLVITESGAVYVTDNGANGGWGGFPVNEGTANVNNDYDPAEPGNTSFSDGEKINNKDHLTLVTQDIQNYQFGSFYGGHCTPVRANPHGAGLYTNPAATGTTGAVFRTLKYHPNPTSAGYTSDPHLALPADWPPVLKANPVEGDNRSPGDLNPDGEKDVLVTIWGTNTNGIDEYTASNFDGSMKGDLIAGVNTGVLRRVELKADGTLEKLTPSFASGIGGDALGITCNSDDDPFPGTIWVATLGGKLVVLEPQDFINCKLSPEDDYDALADNDFDGYTNQDEFDNGTDPCNGASQPGDFDKSSGGLMISDLNDPDDDNDGIPDRDDPFQLGDPFKEGSDAFVLPVTNQLFSSNTNLNGYMGLGLTGLMNNGEPNPNWLNWLDRRDDPNDPNPNDILGGAIGAMTMQMTSGTALGSNNTQEKAFQYGVQTNFTTGIFTVAGGLFNFNAPLQLYGNFHAPNGELGIFIGDGSQSNYIKFVLTPGGIKVQQELNDIPGTPINYDIAVEERPESGASLFFIIDPSTGLIRLEYSKDSDVRREVGSIYAEGAILDAIQQKDIDLAVGLIGSSNAEGVEVEGTWDFLNVTVDNPYVVKQIPDMEVHLNREESSIDLNNFFNDNYGVENLTYSVQGNTNLEVATVISENNLAIGHPSIPTIAGIIIRATDAEGNFTEQTFKVKAVDPDSEKKPVLYRVNAGGPVITSIDAEMDWSGDTSVNQSPYLSQPGGNRTMIFGMTGYDPGVDLAATPKTIFNTERFDDKAGEPNMTYSFPVNTAGVYKVRLYCGNGWSGSSDPGQRVYDVKIEGVIPSDLNRLDLSARFGHQVGGVVPYDVVVTDGAIDISFIHHVENPLLNGIEILKMSEGNPVIVTKVDDQINPSGEELESGLQVLADGGDGTLNYAMTGAPQGLTMNSATGRISGNIDIDAHINSPYTVMVVIDDADEETDDAEIVNFKWVVTSGKPEIVQAIPDLQRNINAPADELLLDTFFDDNGGVENLSYTVEKNTNTEVKPIINGNTLTINYPSSTAESDITIRATDLHGNYAEQIFQIRVIDDSTGIPIEVTAIASQENLVRDELDGSCGVTATGGDGPLVYSMSGAPEGVVIDAVTGSISGTIAADAHDYSPYNVTITVDDSDAESSDAVEINFTWTILSGEPVIAEVMPDLERYVNAPDEAILLNKYFDDNDEILTYTLQNTNPEIGAVITDNKLALSYPSSPAVSDIIIRATDSDGNFVEQTFGVNIIYDPAGVPIEVTPVASQENLIGDELDGSFGVTATGGDGALIYSMSGAPEGLIIDAATGTISGVIASDAHQYSPYNVLITVDDSDDQISDAVETNFTWTILSGEPVIAKIIQDIERYIGAPDEEIVLDAYFDDNDGKENLIYTVKANTNSNFGAVTSNNILFISYPSSPAVSGITIRATDANGNYVEQTFEVRVKEEEIPQEYIVLYRVNAGGPAVAAIDGEMDWGADTAGENSPYLVQPGGNKALNFGMKSYHPDVDLTTTPTGIYNSERYDDKSGAPNMTYSFPVSKPGFYQVRLYFGNGWNGSSSPGQRVYDVEVEGVIPSDLDDLDLSGRFGHQVGGIVTYNAEVLDSAIDISFIHNVENPLINGIEILGVSGGNPIIVADLEDQINISGEELDGSLVVSASGGEGNLRYSMSGAPSGLVIEPTNGQIGGSIAADAHKYSPYNVIITVDDSDEETSDISAMSFTWTIFSGEPFIAEVMPDLERYVDATDEEILLDTHFDDNDEILTYTLQNTNPEIGAIITGNKLTLTYPSSPAVSYITIRATDADGNFVEQTFTVSVIYDPAGIPIEVTPVASQENLIGDELDSSLGVTATGGDGALIYSMSGAPEGVIIDAGTGTISGIIASDAHTYSPYNVIITVDDGDEESSDTVEISFTWTIFSGEPFIAEVMPDLERYVNAPDEEILLDTYFDDNDEILTYNLQNTNPEIGAVISVNKLAVSYPSSSAVSELTIRATDTDGNFVEQTFGIIVKEEEVPEENVVLYRVNAGGPAIPAIDGEMDWSADTSDDNSPYLVQAGGNRTLNYGMKSYHPDVDLTTTPMNIYNSERFDDKSGPPNMTYSFPVTTSGIYQVRLYFGNGWKGSSSPGQRVYDVAIEGVIPSDLNDLDLSGRFGHQVGGIVTYDAEVWDGTLDISFIHNVENPLINGIEILGPSQETIKAEALLQKDSKGSGQQSRWTNLGELKASIYPNPVSSEAYLQLSDTQVEVNGMSLYGYSGQMIKTYPKKELTKVENGLYLFRVSGLPDGIYIVRLDTSVSNAVNLRLIVKN
ncbi:malectin domain-containing carbohydrate-binding protein [Salegentibacter sp. F188]|uniref:Malectin domain-containing carbohydrate-binding protein n=1 Tax=Autumnicola patrickiae TaxID=3075591 RepID=A0ABU3E1Y1_9FLAO|nr:malectin domain-containing carbohydrate-binding protein [Salegentibacter sp. F188]MDT0690004.1 malectin domain-containing carbohydrate-binding protein [Salegentibacter sp. F188]